MWRTKISGGYFFNSSICDLLVWIQTPEELNDDLLTQALMKIFRVFAFITTGFHKKTEARGVYHAKGLGHSFN
jgi:hypothetical protein